MERTYLSTNWHRVAARKLRLRSHVRFHRNHYRDGLWYVLQDRISGRFHRLSPATYFFVSLLDGHKTTQEAWDIAAERLEDEVLTQDEALRLIGQLHAADVLCGDTPPDIDEVSTRGRRQRRRKMVMSLMNPLALRLPLIDPEDFLKALAPVARLVFSLFGALLFVATLAYAGVLVALHWGELTENIFDRVLAAENLLLLLIAYPLIKGLHELGHAFAVKRWGGEVHEIGVMFLVFMPVPYVDASDSMAFDSKWRRALVGAAGILVELLLAAIAVIVWVNAEDGMLRAFAFGVMLIGGVSTVFFNGNPLLRFDGYYVLSDLIEVPNLANRANQYIGYLVQRHAFGVEDARSPVAARGEAKWLFSYALAAFAYRLFIVTVIAMFVGTQFFAIGVLIAIWAVVLMLGVPLFKQLRFLLVDPALRRRRGRAFAVTGVSLAVVTALLTAVPVPHATVAQGVVWPQGDATLYASEDGFVAEVMELNDAPADSGTALLRIVDPILSARVRLLASRVEELERRRAVFDLVRPADAKIAAEELRHAEAELERAQARLDNLIVRSPLAGRVILPNADSLVGRFVRKGDLLGYVARDGGFTIYVAVPEEVLDLAFNRIRALDVRFASRLAEKHPATITRVTPTLTSILPSRALATEGGGSFLLDPTDARGERALTRFLHMEVSLEQGEPPGRVGERAYLRILHEPEPVAKRIYRGIRQVFLKHFNV